MSALRRDDLLGMSRAELADVLANGHAIDPRALDDTQYQGVALGLPRWVVALTWSKFMKTFHRDPSGALRGWNVRIAQDGLDRPWTPLERRGRPRTFGHYEVVAADGDVGPARGLLIDYGRRCGALDPMRFVRDPLVAVNPGDPRLLLGWSYVDLGLAVPTPSYFTLQLDGPLEHIA